MEEKSGNQKADGGGTPFQPVPDNSTKPSSGLSEEEAFKKEISRELESSKASFGSRPSSISEILEKELSGISSDSDKKTPPTEEVKPFSVPPKKSDNLTSSVVPPNVPPVAPPIPPPKTPFSPPVIPPVTPSVKTSTETTAPKIEGTFPRPSLQNTNIIKEEKKSIPEVSKTENKAQEINKIVPPPDLSSVAKPLEKKTGAAKLDDERGAFTPPPTPKISSTVLESEFKTRPAVQNQKEKEFIRETNFSRDRETTSEKREKEFISREPETAKEIIRTFQKDLLRRQNEVRREENIPEKEVIGFAPPIPPEETKTSKPPKLSLPKVPLPKISLKFALIIVALVLFLSGFYLIFQLKPCISPFCKEEEPPAVVSCDKEELRNICVDANQIFPDCDTTGLCKELNIASCSRENICQAIGGPTSTCEPVDLLSPIGILPFLSEEKITITQKTKSDILSALSTIDGAITQRPYMVRVLIEYTVNECEKSWLSAADFFNIFGIKVPADFFTNIKGDNYSLVYYMPDSEEKNTCIASNVAGALCYGPRLGIAFSLQNLDYTKAMMRNWEQTFFSDLSPLILGEAQDSTSEFGGSLYKEKIEFRYKNFPISTTALNYGLYKDILVIGTSKNSLYKASDFIIKKELQQAEDQEAIE